MRRQNTVDGSDLTIKPEDTITELDNEKQVNENLSNIIVSEQKHKTEVKQEDCEGGLSSTDLELSVQEVTEISGCIECVKAIPVFSSDEIDEGDHIAFAGAIYDHHAIVVAKLAGEKFEIIEATNTISGVAVGMFLGKKALIGSSVKSFDFAKQNLRVIAYRIRQHSKRIPLNVLGIFVMVEEIVKHINMIFSTTIVNISQHIALPEENLVFR
ncbi:unnamed protein product [Mytilus edulis]|uniref:Uncharacterized protein n=1 Tax=Mytilus edulis TaxID=6550 RepID=A0A8S3UIZ6_MYTED|nr:unnamed protein product [Mytilus edulis]